MPTPLPHSIRDLTQHRRSLLGNEEQHNGGYESSMHTRVVDARRGPQCGCNNDVSTQLPAALQQHISPPLPTHTHTHQTRGRTISPCDAACEQVCQATSFLPSQCCQSLSEQSLFELARQGVCAWRMQSARAMASLAVQGFDVENMEPALLKGV